MCCFCPAPQPHVCRSAALSHLERKLIDLDDQNPVISIWAIYIGHFTALMDSNCWHLSFQGCSQQQDMSLSTAPRTRCPQNLDLFRSYTDLIADHNAQTISPTATYDAKICDLALRIDAEVARYVPGLLARRLLD